MKLIEERDERNRHRKLMKAQYDSIMTLSDNRKQYRLLGEGMVTYGGGEPWFYITRGTLDRFYAELDADYVGTVKAGHIDFNEFPDRVVGYWSKADLELKDDGDGRKALYVTPTLLTDSPVLKALQSLPFAIGTSVEMLLSENEELTANETLNPYQVPIVDSVDIRDFAFVGNAGDVNSMGVHLKGEFKAMEFEKLKELLDTEGKSIEEVNQLLSALDAPAAEETPEQEAELEAEEESSEEETEEVAEETEEVAEEENQAEDLSEALASVRSLMEELRAELDLLRNENVDLKAKLEAKEEEWKTFSKNLKKLSVSMTDKPKHKEPVEHKVQYTDGIGE